MAKSDAYSLLLERYQQQGFSVIPIAYRGKKPLLDSWGEYQRRVATINELRQWFCSGRKNNLGLVCGQVSGNLVVVDFDSPDAFNVFYEDNLAKGLDLMEKTPVVRTGRGFHVYLRSKTPLETQKFDGGEIRGEGAYVVAPPSVHENGHSYQFINPEVVDIFVLDNLIDLGLKIHVSEVSVNKDPGWVVHALQGVAQGQRDDTCIRLAGHYKAKGLGFEETLIILTTWGAKCNPPFPDKDVQKCVKSAYGYLEREAQNQAKSLEKARQTALKWLKLKDIDIVDITIATIVANRSAGDPVWLLVVGAPSTGKSEILRGLFNCEGVHSLGGFTANTFASGFDKGNVGLLETLPKETTLVVKDFGSLLTMRHEDKAMVLQQLREIYDGEYKKEYGNGKVVHWKGRMGLLGASTSAIENYHSVIGELGNRYILYRCGSEDREEIALRALEGEGVEATMREEIADSFKVALDNTLEARNVEIPKDLLVSLASLADLTSQLRSPVSRDSYDKTVNYLPDVEGPARLAKAFAKLAKALAAVRGKLVMTEVEYQVIRRIAEDTIPRKRVILIGLLLNGEWWRVKAVSKETGLPASTTSYELEDLTLLGILNRDADLEDGQELRQQTPYKYQLKQDIRKLFGVTGILENRSLKNGNG